jgi:16S rRNA (guanine527-N7)-methyltransferase
MPTPLEKFNGALSEHAQDFGVQLSKETAGRLGDYYELLLKWNARLHLVALCSPEKFATRHVLESLMLLPHLPQEARVSDVGSGGGLPIVPCLIARADLRVTMVEASPKKSVFLREALRLTRADEAPQLIVARFEDITAPMAEYVTCRALERFERMLPRLIQWAPPASTLLFFGGEALLKAIGKRRPIAIGQLLPYSERRFLIIAKGSSRLRPDCDVYPVS